MRWRSALERALQGIWYRRGPLTWSLWPLSMLYCGAVAVRRKLYETGVFPRQQFSQPVIVIGNLSVGGTGKTPLTVAVVEYLRARGYEPGVVSRGYRAKTRTWPTLVRADSPAQWVGDEPVLLARRTACPVMIDPVRARGVQALLDMDCDCVVCDDGLQHYPLTPGVTVAVIDGERRHGNGFCLPAGPLREPRSRLRRVDLVVCNGGTAAVGELSMTVSMEEPMALCPPHEPLPWDRLGHTVHAVAGLGHPQRFFSALRVRGLQVIEHPFSDHAAFRPEDLAFDDDLPILMTEKDAVKCQSFGREGMWFVPVKATPEDAFFEQLSDILLKRYDRSQTA